MDTNLKKYFGDFGKFGQKNGKFYSEIAWNIFAVLAKEIKGFNKDRQMWRFFTELNLSK